MQCGLIDTISILCTLEYYVLLYLSNCTFVGLSVPCSSFYDNSIQYTEVQRIGGLQSHLLRIYQDIVLQEISKKASSENDPLGIKVYFS